MKQFCGWLSDFSKRHPRICSNAKDLLITLGFLAVYLTAALFGGYLGAQFFLHALDIPC